MEILPPKLSQLVNKKVAQTKEVSPLFKSNKNLAQVEEVLGLRGRKVRVTNLPVTTEDGTDTYTGTIKVFVRDHTPGDTVELLTEQPYRTQAGQLTRVYARPEDILNAREIS